MTSAKVAPTSGPAWGRSARTSTVLASSSPSFLAMYMRALESQGASSTSTTKSALGRKSGRRVRTLVPSTFVPELAASDRGFASAASILPALMISVVSFPLLLDRDVSLPVAVMTSVQVARENPVVIAAWGLIVAVGLAVGILPVLLGLSVVLPVLGHATGHLYRAAVV